MGQQKATITLATDGDTLTGTMEGWRQRVVESGYHQPNANYAGIFSDG